MKISRPAIKPAISILPVKSLLIANVSSVPKVRQLIALTTDLVCVSAPRNDITQPASCSTMRERITLAASVRLGASSGFGIHDGDGAGLRALAQRYCYGNGLGFDGLSGQRIRYADAMTIDHLPAQWQLELT